MCNIYAFTVYIKHQLIPLLYLHIWPVWMDDKYVIIIFLKMRKWRLHSFHVFTEGKVNNFFQGKSQQYWESLKVIDVNLTNFDKKN